MAVLSSGAYILRLPTKVLVPFFLPPHVHLKIIGARGNGFEGCNSGIPGLPPPPFRFQPRVGGCVAADFPLAFSVPVVVAFIDGLTLGVRPRPSGKASDTAPTPSPPAPYPRGEDSLFKRRTNTYTLKY